MTKIIGLALALAIAVSGVSLAGAAQTSDDAISNANRLLFQSDHLAGMERQSTVHYAFKQRGSRASGFADRIDMTLSPGEEAGTKDVKLDYFTGERHQYVPRISNAEGNPVLMVFLQRDINEMRRVTGGHWRYFQKAIKTALVDDARVKAVSFEFQGERVEGKQVRIEPYQGDEHLRDNMEQYRDKVYVFTLSDAVPGSIYELRTLVPGADGDKALVDEALTYKGLERAQGSGHEGERDTNES